MATALEKAGRLKPEIRLGQAISEFQADLSSIEKSHQQKATQSPPEIRDVMRLTAELSQFTGTQGRCFGPRLTNILQAVQQFAALGDIIVGGSQNILACGVWSLLRFTMLSAVKCSAYFEQLSSMLMVAGRAAPRYQAMGVIYPKSESLRASLTEYFIVIVQLSHHVFKQSQKSTFQRWVAATVDAKLAVFQADLDIWATSIKDEVNLLTAQHLTSETTENSRFRSLITRWHEAEGLDKKLRARKHALDACSTYDHEGSWKRLRKLGNSGIYKKSDEYLAWRDQQDPSTLLCTGKLGCGKSVLLANIVDDLNLSTEAATTIAYFFCQQDTLNSMQAQTVFASLARQLLHSVADLAPASDFIRENPHTDTENLLELLTKTLPQNYQAYIVLDGLDDCKDGERTLLLEALRGLQSRVHLSLCISVRSEVSENLKLSYYGFRKLSMFSLPDRNPDIVDFIQLELERCLETGRLRVNDPSLVLDIREKLTQGAEGMFLWVALQINAICLERTDADIRHAISNLPSDLSDIYQALLQKCGPCNVRHQFRIFQLVSIACRPLTTDELREALSVTPGDEVWSSQNLVNDIYSTLTFCGGLLMVDEEDLGIRMVHHSVMTFLLDRYEGVECFNLQRAHEMMGRIIITYLNYQGFSKELSPAKSPSVHGSSITSAVASTTAESFGQAQRLALRLLRSKAWADNDIGPALLGALGRFKSAKPVYFYRYADSWWQEHIWFIEDIGSDLIQPLIKLLSNVDPNRVDATIRTPLSHVAERGLIQIVPTLLANGAYDTLDSSPKTALIRAVEGQRGLVVILTKHHKIDPNLPDRNGCTPLMSAVVSQFVEGVESLLDLASPLHAVAENGNIKIGQALVRVLGRRLDIPNRRSQTPFWVAAANGRLDIVALLGSNSNVDVNLPSVSGVSPLMIAAQKGHTTVVSHLLADDRVDAYQEDAGGYNALSHAATNDRIPMVQLLSSRVARLLNARNKRGETALWLAAAAGCHAVVKTLSSYEDICWDPAYPNGATPMWIAACNGHVETVKVIMNLDTAQVYRCCHDGATPLWIAACNGHVETVKILVNLDTDHMYRCNHDKVTPLWIAACNGHVETVRALVNLDTGHMDHCNNNGTTPLWIAAHNGHIDTVRALINWHNAHMYPSALNGHAPVIQSLMFLGTIDTDTENHETPKSRRQLPQRAP
ncbi:ankyrin repeat-containing domain protein [Aspergillus pseudoustus]|uniref:Ankyrin repeat-containing domain protein n=1 Tax=Aspergillus pseudoustus TaxID=1810923 RepID=A0ABR4J475_9EURO